MKTICVCLAALSLLGCTGVPTRVDGRMYGLTDGSIIELQLADFSIGHGRASARLKSGESFKGEYTIGLDPAQAAQGYFNDHPEPQGAVTSPWLGGLQSDHAEALPGSGEPSWQAVYGLAPDAKVKPAGTGVLVGDKGTILNMVLFNADPWRGVADGVARSNKGQWYRVHVGEFAEDSRE